jgi:glycine/D-amino acid oxidase-like deaminating enzyme
MADYLKFSSEPLNQHQGKKHIIIVGAGIIGVCTAYYIVNHPKYDPKHYHITILESKRVAGGASGKAGGLLALWAFPQQLVPLSFELHQQLSDKYNGEHEWNYRRLTTVSLEGDLSHLKNADDDDSDEDSDDELEDDSEEILDHEQQNVAAEQLANNQVNNQDTIPPKLQNGVIEGGELILEETYKQSQHHDSDSSSSLSDKPPKKTFRSTKPKSSSITSSTEPIPNPKSKRKTKTILPPDLNWITSSLITNCSNLGGTDTTAQVHPYKFTNFILKKAVEDSKGSIDLIIGKVNQILFSMETGKAIGVNYTPTSLKNKTNDDEIKLFGDQIVLSVGPWTSKILPDCPISGLRAHSITIAPFKYQPVSPYAIFTEFKTGPYKYISPEIYARQDEVYVCGEGDSAVDVPETTDDVEVVKSKCDELFKHVGKISPNLKKGHVLKKQACYLPVLDVPSSSGPLIGETNVENLFLASGHSCWGINNAPATGKVMSELLLDGEAISADIMGLDPSLYFDASVLVNDEDEGLYHESNFDEKAKTTNPDSQKDDNKNTVTKNEPISV